VAAAAPLGSSVISHESNFLWPNATFVIELIVLIAVIVGAIWLLVRYLRRD
jgi:flagellar biogenesis protein FliO